MLVFTSLICGNFVALLVLRTDGWLTRLQETVKVARVSLISLYPKYYHRMILFRGHAPVEFLELLKLQAAKVKVDQKLGFHDASGEQSTLPQLKSLNRRWHL